MVQKSFMEALFGAKRPKRKTTKRKSTAVKRKSKAAPKSLKTQAKKHGVRVTVRRAGKMVPKSEKVLRKQVAGAKKRHLKKKRDMMKKKTARKVTRRHRPRRVAKFGKGADFPPLSAVMSPFPYAISSSPPWI